MLELPPETTQDRTQRKHPVPGYKLKFLTPPGIEPGTSCTAVRRANHYTKQVVSFTSPQSTTYTPGTYNPNARGSDACRGSNSLWTRTLDRHTMCGQHNVRVSAEDNTGQNTKDTHPIPGYKLKFLTPQGIEPGPPGWKAGTLPTTPRRRIKMRYKKYIE